MRVFAPTRTKTWDECPLKNYLESEEKWVPKQASKGEWGKLAGSAFAYGTSVAHDQLKQGNGKVFTDKAFQDEIVKQTVQYFIQDVAHYRDGGVQLEEKDELDVITCFQRALPRYLAECPFQNWSVKDVETPFPDHGNCRIDVGGLDHTGAVAVADLKFKRYLTEDRIGKAIDDYRKDWQFLHYVWAYGETQKVKYVNMYLTMVIAQPIFKIRHVELPFHPDTLALWLESAKSAWKDMEDEKDGKRVPRMAANHSNQYGPCAFSDACFLYHLDEGLMANKYVKIERRKIGA